jgi:dTMP kinase
MPFNTITHLLVFSDGISSSIESSLAQGTIIIADRYAFSGIAFSASKLPPSDRTTSAAPPLSYEWCRAPDTLLPAPDLTLFFDVSPEVARQRGGYGAERYEREEVQARVRTIFEKIGRDAGVSKSWTIIDANKKQDEVTEEVWRKVEPFLQGIAGPVQRLWNDDKGIQS